MTNTKEVNNMKTTKIIFAVVAVVMALTFVLAGCKPSTT